MFFLSSLVPASGAGQHAVQGPLGVPADPGRVQGGERAAVLEYPPVHDHRVHVLRCADVNLEIVLVMASAVVGMAEGKTHPRQG